MVERYGRLVYNIAYRMTGSEADAKDLAQEAFIRVFRAFRRIDPEQPLEGWLYRIVSNLHIDLLRKRPRVRVESLDAPALTPQGEEVARELPDPWGDVPDAVIDRTLDARIQAALLALPVELRMVVILSDIEGHAYEEIATMLRLPLGTVKSRLHRARKILQARLRPVMEERRRGVAPPGRPDPAEPGGRAPGTGGVQNDRGRTDDRGRTEEGSRRE
ncbi:MAG: sigma-70 family RNA polymerase sigma factor [Armatimonadota bacterium]|nr:sigma-70 family RNA polymerase sigma factor [Armatimonadota bacterium]MDR7447834.1 sigma-70 family RNA polymerase sigma factor [Armatimonadota bacterium]MDR7459851.1 sigma-70 family RNA polymerase sigma factor [Armatimonadota bacterium]MDR7479817.1 sigma-70 family RNA polymerase sigma factor [Armatimonadota bacterium]MDR7487520.1 sigma-70 family RNA polymerase sigma factor [Armatimonadota bacterium]